MSKRDWSTDETAAFILCLPFAFALIVLQPWAVWTIYGWHAPAAGLPAIDGWTFVGLWAGLWLLRYRPPGASDVEAQNRSDGAYTLIGQTLASYFFVGAALAIAGWAA